MPVLRDIQPNFIEVERELEEFKKWFSANHFFLEREIVTELKKYDQLCSLMWYLHGNRKPDAFKHEFEIQGVFRADYVVGRKSSGRFLLVEFEGGQQNSIFGPHATNQMRDWGWHIQHGFSQVADWSWAHNDSQNSKVLLNAFDARSVNLTFVVICGRSDTLNQTERDRLDWRSDKTLIGGSKVYFYTFDDLVEHFDAVLDVMRDVRADIQAANSTP